MRQHDRQRHQLLGFVASVAEHQALVARAAGVHTHRDIRRLCLDHVQHAAGLGVEAHLGVGKADVGDDFARQLGHVQHRLGGDFARHDADAGGHQRLAGHAARGIAGQHGVQHRVGNLVRHLVRVAFGHRLGRENMSHMICHFA